MNVRNTRDSSSRPHLWSSQGILNLNKNVVAVCFSLMPKKPGPLGCSQMASGKL